MDGSKKLIESIREQTVFNSVDDKNLEFRKFSSKAVDTDFHQQRYCKDPKATTDVQKAMGGRQEKNAVKSSSLLRTNSQTSSTGRLTHLNTGGTEIQTEGF